MNASKRIRLYPFNSFARRALAMLSILSILSCTVLVGANAQQKQQAKRLSEDQVVLHVLNRLGFGARPGDVERVKAIGIENYHSTTT